ncbi:MAG: DUF11 domain-containing protein, partial [Candidatus Kerfeldbacteria bacterium]|nr:DUF11 domain-containing protein [Candidatus Kerfeldbacteria bacterium]
MQRFNRFARRRHVRTAVWKTLNGLVGIVTILNLSLAGTFLATTAEAQVPTGTLTVHKLADANGDGTFESVDPSSFKWFLKSDPGTLYDMGSSVESIVGGVLVSETGPAGYQFVGWSFGPPEQDSCSPPLMPVIPVSFPLVVVPVTPVGEMVITLCNVHDTGFISVDKNFDDNADGVVDRTNPAGWTWDVVNGQQDNAGGQTVMVPTGSVTVQEDPIPGYSAAWACSDGSSSVGTSHTTSVAVDPAVACTVTNTRDQGTLTVNKEFDDNADGVVDRTNPAGWTWDVVSGQQDNAGGATVTMFTESYTVTEDAVPSYSSSWSCSDQSAGTGLSLTAQVTKGAGLTCTFRNTRVFTPASLTLAKTDNQATANPAETLTYQITLTNSGELNATGVRLVDTIPADVVSVSNISDSGTAASGQITWDNLTVPGLGTKTVSFNGLLRSDFPTGTTTVHNVVSLSCTPSPAPGIGVCAYSGTAADNTNVTVAPTTTAAPAPTPSVRGAVTAPDLSITKRVNQDTAKPGEVVTYTIEV